MANKSRSKHKQALAAAYKAEGRYNKNRRAKLEKLAKVHPNNLQIAEALKNIHYRRHTPHSPFWTSVSKEMAQLIKSVEGYCNPDTFHASDSSKRVNMITPPNPIKAEKVSVKGMFSIKARAHSKGEPIWN